MSIETARGAREALDDRDDAPQLLLGRHRVGAGAGRLAADVEDRRALGRQPARRGRSRRRASSNAPPSENESGVTLTTPMSSYTRYTLAALASLSRPGRGGIPGGSVGGHQAEETPAAAGAEGSSRTTGTAKSLGVVVRGGGDEEGHGRVRGRRELKRFTTGLGARGCWLALSWCGKAAPRGSVLSAMPIRIAAPPISCGSPNGSPNASAPGRGADERLEVQERARELGAGRATARRRTARTARACRPRRARASASTGVADGGAARQALERARSGAPRPCRASICTAVTAIGSRPCEQRRLGDDEDAPRAQTESSTSASPPSVAPPPPPPGDHRRRRRAPARSRARRPGPVDARPVAAAISATSAGTAPTISAAWLTLVCADAGVLEHDHDAVADRAREQDRGRERGAQVRRASEREHRRGDARSARRSASRRRATPARAWTAAR